MSDLKDAAKELAKLARTFAGVAKLAPMLDHLGDLDAYGQRLKKQNATMMLQQDTLRLELANGEAELERKLAELRDKHNDAVARDQAKIAAARDELERLRLKAEQDAAAIINDAKAKAESFLAEAREKYLHVDEDHSEQLRRKVESIDQLAKAELSLKTRIDSLNQTHDQLHDEVRSLRQRLTGVV